MIVIAPATAVLAASWDPAILWTGAYLAGALLVGALAVELFRRYILADRSDRQTASDQLAHFRTLYERGELSEEEFNRLRKLLGVELRGGATLRKPKTDAITDKKPALLPEVPPPEAAGPTGITERLPE